MLLNCGVGEDSWESLAQQGDPTSPFWRKSVLNIHWKDWCWGWSFNTLVTWCKELTHWKRPWCWERLRAGGEGNEEHEMVGWHHWLYGHEFEQSLGVGDGQGSLVCYSSWGRKELNMTEWLNWTEQICPEWYDWWVPANSLPSAKPNERRSCPLWVASKGAVGQQWWACVHRADPLAGSWSSPVCPLA